MNLWQLSLKLLSSNNITNSLSRYNSIISITGLVIAISSIVITSSFSKGYRDNIILSMSNIFGHAYVEKYTLQNDGYNTVFNYMDNEDVEIIKNHLSKLPIVSIYGVRNEPSILYNSKKYYGVVHNKIISNDLKQNFHFSKFLVEGSEFDYNNGYISIGSSLYNDIYSDSLSTISLINISDNSIEGIRAEHLKIGSIYKSNLFDYDDKFLFSVVLDTLGAEKFNIVILQLFDSRNIDDFNGDSFINNNNIYKIKKWDNEFARQLIWLDQFEAPIQLIMYFIFIVSIFHVISSFYILIKEKEKTISILLSVGCSKIYVYYLFFFRSLAIVICSVLISFIISISLLYIQDVFNIIKLPGTIYFVDYLPVSWDINHFIYYPIILIFSVIIILLSIIPKINSINISQSLNNA